jgi:hypothetical protein
MQVHYGTLSPLIIRCKIFIIRRKLPFFIGSDFCIQPGIHLYLRKDNSIDLSGPMYNIPNADISPAVRVMYKNKLPGTLYSNSYLYNLL